MAIGMNDNREIPVNCLQLNSSNIFKDHVVNLVFTAFRAEGMAPDTYALPVRADLPAELGLVVTNIRVTGLPHDQPIRVSIDGMDVQAFLAQHNGILPEQFTIRLTDPNGVIRDRLEMPLFVKIDYKTSSGEEATHTAIVGITPSTMPLVIGAGENTINMTAENVPYGRQRRLNDYTFETVRNSNNNNNNNNVNSYIHPEDELVAWNNYELYISDEKIQEYYSSARAKLYLRDMNTGVFDIIFYSHELGKYLRGATYFKLTPIYKDKELIGLRLVYYVTDAHGKQKCYVALIIFTSMTRDEIESILGDELKGTKYVDYFSSDDFSSGNVTYYIADWEDILYSPISTYYDNIRSLFEHSYGMTETGKKYIDQFHTLFLRGGKVYCYGYNDKNQCDSSGKDIAYENAVEISIINNGAPVNIISTLATKYGSFFISSIGDVYAMGYNGPDNLLGLPTSLNDANGIIKTPQKLTLSGPVAADGLQKINEYSTNKYNYPDMVILRAQNGQLIAFGKGVTSPTAGALPTTITSSDIQVTQFINTKDLSCYTVLVNGPNIKANTVLKCFREVYKYYPNVPHGFLSYAQAVVVDKFHSAIK
jgi:hypothetical protein